MKNHPDAELLRQLSEHSLLSFYLFTHNFDTIDCIYILSKNTPHFQNYCPNASLNASVEYHLLDKYVNLEQLSITEYLFYFV